MLRDLLVLTCLAVSEDSLLASQGDAILRERFVNEAPLAWSAYRDRAIGFQGTIERNIRQFTPWQENSLIRAEFKQRPNALLLIDQRFPPVGEKTHDDEYAALLRRGTLEAVNPRYAFSLKRADADAEWIVTSIDTSSERSRPSATHNVRSISDMAISFLGASPINGIEISMSDAAFQLRSVSLVKDEKRELMLVSFDYRPQSESVRIPSLIEGSLLLDPKRLWTIERSEHAIKWAHQTKGPMKVVASHEYRIQDDGLPVLKRIIAQVSNPETDYSGEQIITFDIEERDVAESEFTLSAFGFLEPGGLGESLPVPIFWWAMLAAFCCLVLAGGYAWWRKRMRS